MTAMTTVSPSRLRELIQERAVLAPVTVDQYHQMLEAGVYTSGDPFELLDGIVVHKDRSTRGENPMTVGLEHVWVVSKLLKLDSKLRRLGCHIRVQQPVTLPPYDEPEPDGAIVRGTEDDYLNAHPEARDVASIIEVADSSLERDRTRKYRIYAKSGIPQYVIINLPDRVIEVFTQPSKARGRYGHRRVLESLARQRVEFALPRNNSLAVPVRQVLPHP